MIEEFIKVWSWKKYQMFQEELLFSQDVYIYPGTIDVYALISTGLSIISKD